MGPMRLSACFLVALTLTGCEQSKEVAGTRGAAQSSAQPKIHKSGRIVVRYENVSLPRSRPQPGLHGPFGVQYIDLDEGRSGSSTSLQGSQDMEVQLHIRDLMVDLLVGRGLRAAKVGTVPVDHATCRDRVQAAQTNEPGAPLEAQGFLNLKAPTPYFCTQTGEGRVSLLRVLSVSAASTGPGNFNVTAVVEYKTWD